MLRVMVRLGVPVAVTLLAVLLTMEGVAELVFGWSLLGYLGVRAWPGVRADLGRVAARVRRGGRPRLVRPSRVGDL